MNIKIINQNKDIARVIINEPKKGMPRQQQIDAYIRDTSVYIFRTWVLWHYLP